MTTFALPSDSDVRDAVVARLVIRFRVPTSLNEESVAFTPDLTTDESATVNDLIRLAIASGPWSSAAYAAVRTEMQALRDLRQLGRNAFMALSATERDRMIYDALVAQTIIDLAILRDE